VADFDQAVCGIATNPYDQNSCDANAPSGIASLCRTVLHEKTIGTRLAFPVDHQRLRHLIGRIAGPVEGWITPGMSARLRRSASAEFWVYENRPTHSLRFLNYASYGFPRNMFICLDSITASTVGLTPPMQLHYPIHPMPERGVAVCRVKARLLHREVPLGGLARSERAARHESLVFRCQPVTARFL